MTGPEPAPAPASPIPAATLIVMRDRPGAPPALLMVERARSMAFAAGAMVFPGGRIDPGDYTLAETLGLADEADAAARIAALRETLEESGLAIGFDPMPAPDDVAAMRAALHGGEALGPILARYGFTLDLAALVPWARWCPNHRQSRNFDTRFYLARYRAGHDEASVDETENVRLIWAGADEVLAMASRGEAGVIFPTRRNLERLAQFSDFDSAAAHALAIPVRLIRPWMETRADGPHLCIPDDQGYPVTSEPLETAGRG